MGFSPKPGDFRLKPNLFAFLEPLTEIYGNEGDIFKQVQNLIWPFPPWGGPRYPLIRLQALRSLAPVRTGLLSLTGHFSQPAIIYFNLYNSLQPLQLIPTIHN